MNVLTGKFSRIVFAVPFAVFGLFHFVGADQMAAMMQGWPAATLLVYVSGAGFLAVAVAIIINKYARLASLLLALELLIIVLTMHVPQLSDPEKMQLAMVSLLKDISLMGAALMIAGIMGNNKSKSQIAQ